MMAKCYDIKAASEFQAFWEKLDRWKAAAS